MMTEARTLLSFACKVYKAQVANGETLDPPTSELKLMREYQSTESDPFAADVIHRWTVPQRSPDLR